MNSCKLIYSYVAYFLILYAHSKGIVNKASDFLRARRSSTFVDKTLLIKTVFETEGPVLITAPPKFGKSTNLDMLRKFLSQESNNNREIIHIFKNLNIYENNSIFFREHFAKHPVVYVDFKSGITTNYNEAIRDYKRSIHNAYVEHEYLIESQHLSHGDKKACRKWCSQYSYKKMGQEHVVADLAGLVRMVRTHFSKTVVVLIDEYDCVVNNALFSLKSNLQFEDIIALTTDILTQVLKGNNNVHFAVVTGVSYFSTTGLWEINNLQEYRFLDDHPFVGFYGLTEDEVSKLLNEDKFNSYSNKSELATQLYNGYVCKRGRRIYNTYSFLSFLQTGKAIEYMAQTIYPSGIFNILKYPGIQIQIISLLDNQSINVTLYNSISIREVFVLKKLYLGSKKLPPLNVDLFMSHLLEIGFLTYQTVNGTESVVETEVKIPNRDVYSIIFNEFKELYIDRCSLSSSLKSAKLYPFLQAIVSANKNCVEWLGSNLNTVVVTAVKKIIENHV